MRTRYIDTRMSIVDFMVHAPEILDQKIRPVMRVVEKLLEEELQMDVIKMHGKDQYLGHVAVFSENFTISPQIMICM